MIIQVYINRSNSRPVTSQKTMSTPLRLLACMLLATSCLLQVARAGKGLMYALNMLHFMLIQVHCMCCAGHNPFRSFAHAACST
jgi:hypothetical protein